MSMPTPDDYKKEAIRVGNVSNKYMKKVKLPKNMITEYKYCRNCNRKNLLESIWCMQCGKSSFSKRKLR